jgi:adenylylsulfate kinase-like enzyme
VLADLAGLLADQAVIVIVAATAPRRAHRERARGGRHRFVEVWVRTALADCEARDVKGLYARARAGAVTTLPCGPRSLPTVASMTRRSGHFVRNSLSLSPWRAASVRPWRTRTFQPP